MLAHRPVRRYKGQVNMQEKCKEIREKVDISILKKRKCKQHRQLDFNCLIANTTP